MLNKITSLATAEIINIQTCKELQQSYVVVSGVLFLLWIVTVFILFHKNKEITKLKRRLKKLKWTTNKN